MVKISISDGSSKNVYLHLEPASVSMITRFLHFIAYADNSRYDSAAPLQMAVSEFYDSNYESSMLNDAKILKHCLDYIIDDLI